MLPGLKAYWRSNKFLHLNIVLIYSYVHVYVYVIIQDDTIPPDSHVLLVGLADGLYLWESLHNRYHPLGRLNHDILYPQFYAYLSCLEVTHCHCFCVACYLAFSFVFMWCGSVMVRTLDSRSMSSNPVHLPSCNNPWTSR